MTNKTGKFALVVFDCETTGVGDDAHILQLSCIISTDRDSVSVYNTYANPGVPIPEEAKAIHGITEEFVASSPSPDYVVEKWLEFVDAICTMKRATPIFAGHNLPFDVRRVQRYVTGFDVTHSIDTLRLFRRMYPTAVNHKLETMIRYFGEFNGQAHNALHDCKAVHDIIWMLTERHNKSLKELADECAVPQRFDVMPFGKYKGRPVEEVPKSYLKWVLGLPDLDPDILLTIGGVLEAA